VDIRGTVSPVFAARAWAAELIFSISLESFSSITFCPLVIAYA